MKVDQPLRYKGKIVYYKCDVSDLPITKVNGYFIKNATMQGKQQNKIPVMVARAVNAPIEHWFWVFKNQLKPIVVK